MAEATYDVIRTTLTRSGAGMPNMRLLIPIDGIGPILVGSTPTFEYPTPEGYDEVEFRGTPQMTRSRGDETRHAWDSIDMALQFARTNRYSRIFFNRSWARITDRMIQSRIRPDVVAEARLNLRLTPRYRPYEILSPGQSLRQRQEDYPIHPEIAPVEGHKYKTLRWIKALLYLSDYPRQPDLSQQLAKRRDQGVPRALAGRRRLRPPSWRLVKTNKT